MHHITLGGQEILTVRINVDREAEQDFGLGAFLEKILKEDTASDFLIVLHPTKLLPGLNDWRNGSVAEFLHHGGGVLATKVIQGQRNEGVDVDKKCSVLREGLLLLSS